MTKNLGSVWFRWRKNPEVTRRTLIALNVTRLSVCVLCYKFVEKKKFFWLCVCVSHTHCVCRHCVTGVKSKSASVRVTHTEPRGQLKPLQDISHFLVFLSERGGARCDACPSAIMAPAKQKKSGRFTRKQSARVVHSGSRVESESPLHVWVPLWWDVWLIQSLLWDFYLSLPRL